MPSEKVTRILLSKTDATEEEIAHLTEAQAWRRVYSLPRPRLDERLQVCFTGFGATRKAQLSALAEQANLKVVTRVTRDLRLLVCGPNAGPKKIEKAGAQGVTLLEATEFERFLRTGEVSDSPTA